MISLMQIIIQIINFSLTNDQYTNLIDADCLLLNEPTHSIDVYLINVIDIRNQIFLINSNAYWTKYSTNQNVTKGLRIKDVNLKNILLTISNDVVYF
ncbi:unnamed protein product [Rotaria magnacalcarata]